MNKFNSNQNVIITLKDQISSPEVEEYLIENMAEFPSGSKFIILCGHHHRAKDDNNPTFSTIEIDERDDSSVDHFKSVLSNIATYCEGLCKRNDQNCECVHCMTFKKYCQIWKEKQFKISVDDVLPIFTNFHEDDNRFFVDEDSRDRIKKSVKELIASEAPHVLIFASCWSHYSEINQILCSSGLFSVLSLSKDRHDITEGKIFKLNDDQRKLIELVCDDHNQTKKDFILIGESISYT